MVDKINKLYNNESRTDLRNTCLQRNNHQSSESQPNLFFNFEYCYKILPDTGMTRDTAATKNLSFSLFAINIRNHCTALFLFIPSKGRVKSFTTKWQWSIQYCWQHLSDYLRKPIKRSRITRRGDARTLHRQNIISQVSELWLIVCNKIKVKLD